MPSPKIEKCLECNFPTRQKMRFIVGGKKHPFCRRCQARLPESMGKTRVDLLMDELFGKEGSSK